MGYYLTPKNVSLIISYETEPTLGKIISTMETQKQLLNKNHEQGAVLVIISCLYLTRWH